jgi:hypothetical protein
MSADIVEPRLQWERAAFDCSWPKAGFLGLPPLPRDFRPELNDALSAVATPVK